MHKASNQSAKKCSYSRAQNLTKCSCKYIAKSLLSSLKCDTKVSDTKYAVLPIQLKARLLAFGDSRDRGQTQPIKLHAPEGHRVRIIITQPTHNAGVGAKDSATVFAKYSMKMIALSGNSDTDW